MGIGPEGPINQLRQEIPLQNVYDSFNDLFEFFCLQLTNLINNQAVIGCE